MTHWEIPILSGDGNLIVGTGETKKVRRKKEKKRKRKKKRRRRSGG